MYIISSWGLGPVFPAELVFENTQYSAWPILST